MDATVATGAAAMMAIRVLLDHDVPEENILVASLLMAASGNLISKKSNEPVSYSHILINRCTFDCLRISQGKNCFLGS
jgi:uracil phosphoribosyltransferase